MKKLLSAALSLFLLMFFSPVVQAQETNAGHQKDSVKNETANTIVEKAEIEASVDAVAWRSHLEKNLISVIEKAAKSGMKVGQYTVNVRFLVEKDGSISDVKALNDFGYGLAQSAVRVVRTGPKWSAGEINGHKVRSYHTQPITFAISEK